MESGAEEIFEQMLLDYPALNSCRQDIHRAFEIFKNCYQSRGKVLICGNGGSAADAEHIVAELMKGFRLKRPVGGEFLEQLWALFPDEAPYLAQKLQGALPAIALVSQAAIITAFANDVDPEMVYAQQVYGYAREGDVLLAISTSGNSRNVINAVKVARASKLQTVGLTGGAGGILKSLADVTIAVPAQETYRIQEYHLPVYHALCSMIEREFYKE